MLILSIACTCTYMYMCTCTCTFIPVHIYKVRIHVHSMDGVRSLGTQNLHLISDVIFTFHCSWQRQFDHTNTTHAHIILMHCFLLHVCSKIIHVYTYAYTYPVDDCLIPHSTQYDCSTLRDSIRPTPIYLLCNASCLIVCYLA